MARAKQRDEKFWTAVCAEYRRGGKTVAQVAAKHGVKACTLGYHLYAGRDASSRKKRSAGRFLPVKLTTPPREVLVEIATGNGLVMRTEVGADVEYVVRLARALRDGC